MTQLKNPVLPGFHPDPSICRRGKDYYLAVSSFEWFPGVPVYHSRDLKNWKLITHCIQDEMAADLRRLPSAKGIWAPCLSWCQRDQLFYLQFSIMNSMNARFFDVDNYVITAPDIYGPWSKPVYTHSAGFDPSMLHDDDGKKYIVSLEWETRDGYHKPGVICAVEYDAEKKHIVGLPKRIWMGGTKRGCIEGPHIYKRNGYYYLICAEGGTGYGHAVTVGRSRSIWGPYESDPCNPILTSTSDFDEMDNDDARKLNRYNPESVLQKAGHGSIVETELGEVYMVHHVGRPFLPELRCTLGRETAMQKMYWNEEGWLRLWGGGNLAKEFFEASELPEVTWEADEERDDFNEKQINLSLYSPRNDPAGFTDLVSRPGWLLMRGQESLSSLNRASLLAHKLTSLHADASVKMEFSPEAYQHYAGICIYYDNMDYILLRKTYSEAMNCEVIDLLRVKNGQRAAILEEQIKAGEGAVWFRVSVRGRRTCFCWSKDGKNFLPIGPDFDTSEFSDEFCENGEFTGTFLGFYCVDALLHEKTAAFDYFEYKEG